MPLKFQDANEHELWVGTFLSRAGLVDGQGTAAYHTPVFAAEFSDKAVELYRERVPDGLPVMPVEGEVS